jgi:hypothetical protein
MHGCRSGNNAMRRHQCSTRRRHGGCEQTMVPAQPPQERIVEWLHPFQPDAELRRLMLDTIQADSGARPGDDAERCKLVLSIRPSLGEGRPDRRRQTKHGVRELLHGRLGGASQAHKGGAASEATIAGATGLEPAASGVTGRRSNQLSYAPAWRHARGCPSAARRAKDSMPSGGARRGKPAGEPPRGPRTPPGRTASFWVG